MMGPPHPTLMKSTVMSSAQGKASKKANEFDDVGGMASKPGTVVPGNHCPVSLQGSQAIHTME